jgi:hypothetical protein
MKSLLVFVLTLASALAYSDDALQTALTAADDARIAAMLSPDRAKLDAIFSDELRYAHSSGVIDTKASFLDVLVSGKTKYLGYKHLERSFTFPAPGIALMNGRAKFQVETEKGKLLAVLGYLAVWRLEGDQWKFLAWQSCRLPDEPAKP